MSILISNIYRFGEFVLYPQSRLLKRAGEVVPLTPKAFDVLFLLVQKPGKTLTKDELMKAVWGDSFVEESNLTQTIFMVRKALDETPDLRYILTVQGQGYKFVVPVTEEAEEVAEAQDSVPISDAATPPGMSSQSLARAKNWRTNAVAATALALLLLAALALWFWHLRRPPVQALGKTMLAVLPFENFTGDAGQEYFSDGLTEELIGQLGNLDPVHLGVIARTSMMHYKHSQESIPQIANALGVQYVIEGSVRRDSKRVRITAQLIQAKDQTHLWTREYDRNLEDLLELQSEIARDAASEIELSLLGDRPTNRPRKTNAMAPGTQSYEAYDSYLKGRYFWNKRSNDGFQQAARYFQQAIDKDPNYGRAYAGLADTFALMSTWFLGPQNELMPKARTAALRALALDESLAEAHASLALIKESYDYDFPGAEKEFRRAIELDPQYATAHQWYAESLCWQGRFNEAFAESARARQLDPLSMIIGTDYASILYDARQYESAIQQSLSVVELDPNFEHARNSVIPSYLEMGKYDEAIHETERWAAIDEGIWTLATEAAVYGRSGRRQEAHRALAKLEKLSLSRPERTAALLIAYSGTGQKERLLELLQQAYLDHSNALMQIKVEPMYDPIRNDPRFQDLLGRIGLGK